jgi:hypothetical protein
MAQTVSRQTDLYKLQSVVIRQLNFCVMLKLVFGIERLTMKLLKNQGLSAFGGRWGWALFAAGLLAAVSGCVVAPAGHRGVMVMPPPVVVAPVPQPVYVQPGYPPPVYVAPMYPSPGIGWIWSVHPRQGWGWHHPQQGWHKGWH